MRLTIKRVCVPTDFSPQADHAMAYGATLAKHFGASLHLLHIVEDIGPSLASAEGLDSVSAADILASLEKSARTELEELPAAELRNDFEIVRHVAHGVPFQEISRYAQKEEIDILVLGTHGRTGLKHFLIGSVAERVVRMSPCPVLTVRSPEHEFIMPD